MSNRNVEAFTDAWPPPTAKDEERIRLVLYGAGGRMMLSHLRQRVGRSMTTMEMDRTVNAMMDKGKVTLEHTRNVNGTGRCTWVILAPVKDPVGPVVPSAAWLAYTGEEESR